VLGRFALSGDPRDYLIAMAQTLLGFRDVVVLACYGNHAPVSRLANAVAHFLSVGLR